jgi:hypothetical protein
MNAIPWGKIAQKGRLLFCLILLLFFASGCGSSSGDDPISCPGDPGCPDNPGSNVNMAGTWYGNTGEVETTFNLTQDGSNILGTLQLSTNDNTIDTEDVSGSVSGSTVEISATFRGGNTLEFSYKGTVTGDTYSGNLTGFENGRETIKDTFSLTKGSPTDNDIPNFNGDWEIFEEQRGGNYYVQYRYTVSIEQTGTQATLSKGNDHMTCNVVGDDLVCEGRFFYEEDELTVAFESYQIRLDNNNGLTGEASWSITSQGNDYYGRSQLTTTRPEEGSVRIYNSSDYDISILNVSPCDSDEWGENYLNDPIPPDQFFTLFNLQSGCYNVRACEDEDTHCLFANEETINGGETSRLGYDPDRSLRFNQNSIDPVRFTGSMTRELKKPDR